MALSKDQWAQIRRSWEYDPDRPSDAEAGKRAGEKFGFAAPRKQSIYDRRKAEGWERKGTADMASVNAAAQRKADKIPFETVGADPKAVGQAAESAGKKGADPAAAASSTEDAENKRAEVLARHRKEWVQVGVLRQEALAKRPQKDAVGNPTGKGSIAEAFEAMKLTKITAEATHIQQAGERKAWGLDIVVDPDQLKNLSDEDLELIASGKMPKGMR
jgi:hypothetical protein